MRRWRSTAWSVAAAAITLSSAALPTSGYQSAYREDAETSTAPYRVYALERVTPSDAKRMFLDLHGELPRDARILADDERGELIVTGPDSVQRLAQQLVAQLNAGNQTRSSQAPARIVRTYEVQSSQLSLIQDQLTNQLSSSARIAVDSSNQRIVIAGSAQDHALAERLLRSQTVARPTQLEQARSDSPFAEPSLPADPSLPNETSAFNRPSAFTQQDDSQHAVRFRFRNITTAQASTALRKLLTPRVVEHSNGTLSFSAGKARTVSMTFDEVSRSCLLEGSRDLVVQFEVLLRQFDDARDRDVTDQIRFVSMKRVDPGVLNKAILLWQQSRRGPVQSSPTSNPALDNLPSDQQPNGQFDDRP